MTPNVLWLYTFPAPQPAQPTLADDLDVQLARYLLCCGARPRIIIGIWTATAIIAVCTQ